MKICLISFDFFDFDHYIVQELKKRNIDAKHIDISKFQYKYASFFDKIINFFSKLFFNKNIKKIKTEQYILDCLNQFGRQDFILVIRPDRISKKTHLQIKEQTEKYISYIYDSCNRFPIDHLLKGIFDKVFSFDLFDCKKYNFTFITNYIYLEKTELLDSNEIKNTAFIILSIDERLNFLYKIADVFTSKNINFRFIIVGKQKPKLLNKNILYSKKNIFSDELKTELSNSKIFLDLIRKNHNGLSFRVFEALAMHKKIITTNQSIKEYDFYNPNNILVIDETNITFEDTFFKTPYQSIPDDIYNKYTISTWVDTVFKI